MDSKEGFPWQHVLEKIQNSPLPPKTHFCIFFFYVCSFFSPLHIFVWKGGKTGRQDCESGHWTWSFPAARRSCTHLTWDLDSIRALKWLLLRMDFASSWVKSKLSLMCSVSAFIVSPTWIHTRAGLVLFPCFSFLSLKAKPRNEVGTLDQISSSVWFKDFRWSQLISPGFRCLNEKWPSESNDCTFPLIWQTLRSLLGCFVFCRHSPGIGSQNHRIINIGKDLQNHR